MDDGASADFDATVARLRADGLEVDVIVDDAGRYAILREPAGTTPPTGQEQPQSPPPRPRPTRRLAIGLALVIAAVFAVVALTSTDEPDEREAQPTPTTTAEPTLRVKPSPTPTRPVVEDALLLDVDGDWELFAFTDQEVARIEMAGKRMTRTPLPALSSSGPVNYLVGADRALIMPLDNVAGYVVRDGRMPEDLPSGLSVRGRVFAGPPGQVWVAGHQSPEATGMSLRDLNGKRIGKPITLKPQFYPEVSDGRGGVIGAGIGGAYLIEPGGVERITTGRVAAVGPNHFLTHECDQRARCRAEVIDRETGAKRAVDIEVDSAVPTGAISATGEQAAIMVYSDGGSPQLYLFDLDTGRSRTLDVVIPEGTFGQEMAWSPDGRWLLTSSDGELVAVDARTAEVLPVGVNLRGVRAVVVRK